MRRVIFMAMLAAIFCWSTAGCAPTNGVLFRTFTLPVDNEDAEAIGYKVYSSGTGYDEVAGIISICLDDKYAFVVDEHHGNVKRIDLCTGKTLCSGKVSNRLYPWIRDVVVFNNKVYVSDDFDSVFVFDTNLSRITEFPLGDPSPKFFIGAGLDSLDIYVQLRDTIAYVDTLNHIVAYEIGNHPYPYGMAHGKKYNTYTKNGKQYFKSGNIEVELSVPIPDLSDRYDAINVDFNSKYLVYFDANEREFTLYVYSLTGKK